MSISYAVEKRFGVFSTRGRSGDALDVEAWSLIRFS
jgi:hypothetical protein